MSIQGNLATLELADLLQLLSQGGKSGALIVDNGRIEKKIYFDRGVITCAASTDPREHLSRYLVRHGIVDQATLQRAELLQKNRPISLGKGLVELGAITEAELLKVVRQKVEESCYELFRWTDGQFRFNADEHPAIELVPLSISVTGIVMEGMHQLDNWNRGQDELSFKDEATVAPPSRQRDPLSDDEVDSATTLIAPLAAIRLEQEPAVSSTQAIPQTPASPANVASTPKPEGKPAASAAAKATAAPPADPTAATDGDFMFGSLSAPAPAAKRNNTTVTIAAGLMIAAIAVLALMLSRGTAKSTPDVSTPPSATDQPAATAAATPTAPVDVAPSAPTDAEVAAMENRVAELVASRTEQLEGSYKAKYDAELEAMRRQLEQARQDAAAKRTPPPSSPEQSPSPVKTDPAVVDAATLPQPSRPVESATPDPAPPSSPGSSPAAPNPTVADPGVAAPSPTAPSATPVTAQPVPSTATPPTTTAPVETASARSATVNFGDLVEPGPGVELPTLERELQPRYPENARHTNRSATVVLRALVSESGKVVTLDPVGAEVGFGFDRAAADAAKRSKWKPATKNGVAVKMWVTLKIDFKP